MEPSQSPEAPLRPRDVARLFDIAEAAIAAALLGRRPEPPALDQLPASLRAPSGVFVTLTVASELNGCIGTTETTEPLGLAVHRLALAAAFDDQRLDQLQRRDFAHLTIGLSLLTPLTPMRVGSRVELLQTLRPGVDGLSVTVGSRQGLFLPAVWERIPDPDDFLDHLWRKAGLHPRTWPTGIRLERFTAHHFERRVGAGHGDTAA